MKKKIVFIAAAIVLLPLAYILLDTGSPVNVAEPGDFRKPKGTIDLSLAEKEAVPMLQALLRMRTIRSQEIQVTRYLQKVLRREGIPSRVIIDPAYPDRANLVAELKPSKPASGADGEGIILAAHTDVVEADPREWKTPPFSGKLENGRVYGRGALDMKGHLVMALMAFINLKRRGVELKRPIMFLALADEESNGSRGIQFLIKKHRDIFKGYKYVLNEGGVGSRDVAVKGSKVFNIQFAEKGQLWMDFKARGESGHGARPAPTYALENMVRFFTEVREMETGITITPETATFFYQLGTISSFPNSFFLKRSRNPLVKSLLVPTIRKNRFLTAMTTNTRAYTALHTNEDKGINVIANEAYGKLDIRVLPGQTTKGYMERIKKIAAKYKIEVKVQSSVEPDQSSVDTPMFRVLARIAMDNVPGSIVTPFLSPGNTDNVYMRKIGLQCYGLTPALLTSEEIASIHGKDESIRVESLRLGMKVMYETLVGMN